MAEIQTDSCSYDLDKMIEKSMKCIPLTEKEVKFMIEKVIIIF